LTLTIGEHSIEEFLAGDGYPLRYRRYTAAEPVKARVVCVHGIQSHGGWYEQSCRNLSEAGFAVSFLDRRGSGLNQDSRGDAPSFRRLLDDLAEFIREELKANSSSSPVPLFLIGISWGGKLAVALERRHPGLVNGLALLCPGFFPKVRPSVSQRLSIALARLYSPCKLFPIPLNDPELFTANPRGQKFIQEDELGLRQATARLLVESVRLDAYVRLSEVNFPVLMLLAEQDRIIDNARTRRFVEKFATPDKTIIEYPGAYHTLEFEPDPTVFLADLRSWLLKHAEKLK
jgi:alpha-beta hydrolase superfamily lysophospholipase